MTRWQPRVLVVVPTYDETQSLPAILGRLHRALPEVDVLVVDDSSPDGTGEWVREHSERDPRLHLLERPAKSGLASAYVEGLGWGTGAGYDVLVQMDADGSHRPEQVAKLIARMDGPDHPDLVIGSRWVTGGEMVGWSRSRELLSRAGNLYIHVMLGLGVHDATAGFRAHRASWLSRSGVLARVGSTGYGFQVEMTSASVRSGAVVAEVPISFDERRFGVSKLSGDIFWEELRLVTREGVARWTGRWGAERSRATRTAQR